MMNSGAAVKDTSRRLGVAPQPGPTRWVAGVASAGGVASPSVGTWWPVWVVAAASLALAGFAVQAWLDVAAVVALGLAVLVLAVLGFAAVLHRRLAVAEHDLARAQTEIERLSRSKSEFMNSAGHDLRHPVQAALLFQELLTRRLRGTAHEELIGNLGLSLGAMKAMLEAMLEVARLDVLTIPCLSG